MKGADFGEARHVSFEGDHPMYPLRVSVQCKEPPEFQLLNMYRDLPSHEHPDLDACSSVEHWLWNIGLNLLPLLLRPLQFYTRACPVLVDCQLANGQTIKGIAMSHSIHLDDLASPVNQPPSCWKLSHPNQVQKPFPRPPNTSTSSTSSHQQLPNSPHPLLTTDNPAARPLHHPSHPKQPPSQDVLPHQPRQGPRLRHPPHLEPDARQPRRHLGHRRRQARRRGRLLHPWRRAQPLLHARLRVLLDASLRGRGMPRQLCESLPCCALLLLAKHSRGAPC